MLGYHAISKVGSLPGRRERMHEYMLDNGLIGALIGYLKEKRVNTDYIVD